MGPARQEEANAAAERHKNKAANGLKDFYRFQVREERKKAQGELLRKFEDDRRRLQEMKRKRGRLRVCCDKSECWFALEDADFVTKPE